MNERGGCKRVERNNEDAFQPGPFRDTMQCDTMPANLLDVGKRGGWDVCMKGMMIDDGEKGEDMRSRDRRESADEFGF